MEACGMVVVYLSGSWNSEEFFRQVELDAPERICLDFSGLDCPVHLDSDLVSDLVVHLSRLSTSSSVAVTGIEERIQIRLKRAGLRNKVIFSGSVKAAAEQMHRIQDVTFVA